MKNEININCDLGEGGSLDAEIMPLITSCNIACGGHFGDKESVQKAMLLAKQDSVLIGAHPSYPDPTSFGRVAMAMSDKDLIISIVDQLSMFFNMAKDLNLAVHHIKPHGALYHEVASNHKIAALFLEAVHQFSDKVKLFTAPNSELLKTKLEAKRISIEVFADRAYHSNGKLVSRAEENAVLSEPEQVSQQVLHLALHQKVKSIDGDFIKLHFDTLCFHSDTPNALKNLQWVNHVLTKNQINIQKANA